MAHFAKIEDGVVTQVLVVDNTEEHRGQDFLAIDLGLGGTWIKTSNNIRKQYAGIGYTYDPVADVFIAPQPYLSWSLDNNFDWQPPTPRPEEGFWYWNEEDLKWVEISVSE
jgi:hypothetical protein